MYMYSYTWNINPFKGPSGYSEALAAAAAYVLWLREEPPGIEAHLGIPRFEVQGSGF